MRRSRTKQRSTATFLGSENRVYIRHLCRLAWGVLVIRGGASCATPVIRFPVIEMRRVMQTSVVCARP